MEAKLGPTKRVSRILIAEDNFLFRRGLSALFGSDPAFQVVGEATNAHDVLSQIQELRPNVLVIGDGLLNPLNQQWLGQAIRQAEPGLRTLLLAQNDSEQIMETATSCGARGLVLKGATSTQLVDKLRHVAFREGGMNASGLLPEFHALASQATAVTGPALTVREQEVVKLLAEGRTVRSVAKELALSMKTIEAHKLNLMRKLDIHDRATLVNYANRNGMAANAYAVR